MAQTLHNLLKTLHRFVLIHLLRTVIVNIVSIFIKNVNNNKDDKDSV